MNRLYLFDAISEISEQDLERSFPCLSAERLEKVLDYYFPLDRKLAATGYLLLRFGLKELYGIDEPVIFTYQEMGKPFLRDYPHICFNLSHCAAAVACIFSDTPVGVDVEKIISVPDHLAGFVLTEAELADWQASAEPDFLFFNFWTAKESFLKKSGRGIEGPLNQLSAESIPQKIMFQSPKGYCGCAAGICGGLETVLIESFTKLLP